MFITRQRRGLTPTIKRELRRRSAIEPMIGHMKADGRLGRNHLLGATGDAMNALLVAAGQGSGGQSVQVPGGVREVLVQRLAHLSPACRTMLDVAAVYTDVLTGQVAGFYDPEAEYMALVRRGAGTPDTPHAGDDMVLVHEVVHAIQDQHFDLEAFTDLDPMSDAAAARSAVVEGDATWAMMKHAGGTGGAAGCRRRRRER